MLANVSGIFNIIGTYRVDVGIWVLRLAVLGQDTRSDLVHLAHELEHWVIWQLAECELPLRHISGIGLAKNGVSITRNNATTVEC